MLVGAFNGSVVVKSSRTFVRSSRPQARVVHVVDARDDVPLQLHRVAATKYVTALLNMNIYITFTHCQLCIWAPLGLLSSTPTPRKEEKYDLKQVHKDKNIADNKFHLLQILRVTFILSCALNSSPDPVLTTRTMHFQNLQILHSSRFCNKAFKV